MMKRWFKRVCLGTLAVAIALGLTAWILLTWVLVRPTSYAASIDVGQVKLREWAEHDQIYGSTTFPYILHVDGQVGALEYVGALHTSDAEEQQLKEIERRWREFEPTVALCEGRARMNRFATRNQTGTLSESTLTRILAYRNGARLFTLEPTYEAEVAGLLDHYEPRMVATYLTLRVYTTEAQGGQNLDGLAASLLRKRTDVEGLRGIINSVEELDAFWNETFAGEPNWRSLRNTDTVPTLIEVGNVSRQVRGEHMVRTLTELVQSGERVFAVVGASHVIRQEPVLRQLLHGDQATDSLAD